MSRRRTRVLLLLTGLAAAVTMVAAQAYRADLRAAEQRLAGRSEVVKTRSGQMEYAVAGNGTPILMVHGTGGGFDQGLTFTEGLVRNGFKIIAPSRFGYLRSDFPADPSSERQADAFVDLLDSLGIDRVTVAGGSAGALSAAQFALRHPERCAALILIVPAANVKGRDPVEMSPVQRFAVRRLTTSNLLFWTMSHLARDQMVRTLLATEPDLVRQAPAPERARAYRILDEIMPVEQRSRGMLNDARLAGSPPPMNFSDIRVPTLIVSAKDDRFGTAETARALATAVPQAKVHIFPDGGHIWVGHDHTLWRIVAEFVSQTSGPAAQR